MNLHKAHILITGARRGIGWTLAQACARRKAHLILLSRESLPPEKAELLKQLGALSLQHHSVNLSQPQTLQHFLKTARASSLKVDVLVNNAGLLVAGPFAQHSMESVREMLEVNISALITLSHFFLPQMLERKKGLIVNHSSVSTLLCSPMTAVYSASKSAVFAFSLALQKELKGSGVDILTLVTPGVETEMYQEVRQSFQLHSKGQIQLGRGLDPEAYGERVACAMEKGKGAGRGTGFLYPQGKRGLWLFLARCFPHGFPHPFR